MEERAEAEMTGCRIKPVIHRDKNRFQNLLCLCMLYKYTFESGFSCREKVCMPAVSLLLLLL